MIARKWQDPATHLNLLIAIFRGDSDGIEVQKIGSLLGDFCQAVTEGINDELEAVGNVEF